MNRVGNTRINMKLHTLTSSQLFCSVVFFLLLLCRWWANRCAFVIHLLVQRGNEAFIRIRFCRSAVLLLYSHSQRFSLLLLLLQLLLLLLLFFSSLICVICIVFCYCYRFCCCCSCCWYVIVVASCPFVGIVCSIKTFVCYCNFVCMAESSISLIVLLLLLFFFLNSVASSM